MRFYRKGVWRAVLKVYFSLILYSINTVKLYKKIGLKYAGESESIPEFISHIYEIELKL